MNSGMTKKERVLAALYKKETDRIPFSPLCDDYFASSLEKQNHPYDLLRALRYIGADIVERHSPCCEVRYGGGITVESREVGGGKRETHFITKYGEIYDRFYFQNGAMYTEKHLLSTPEDVKVMTHIARNTQYIPRFELFEERKKAIGDDGIPTPTAPCSPLLETLQVLCGLENTTYLLLDEEDAMREMFAALHERNKNYYRLICDLDTPVVFAYEDTSTTIMSRDWFQSLAAPCLNEYAKILHGAGKLYITHMCGKLSGFSEDIAKILSDGIDSVCPPTTGDMECWDAKSAFGGKVIIGGIEPSSLVMKSEEAILSHVSEILERMRGGRGFILSTGDAVPHGTSVELLKKIADLVAREG